MSKSSAYLPGSEKYATALRSREAETARSQDWLVDKANQVSIYRVLHDFFNLEIPESATSWKSRCPFSHTHPDGGISKGWRVYPETNTSHCFVLCGFLPPVRLIQEQYRLNQRDAARKLLDYYGLLKPGAWEVRFKAVQETLGKHSLGDLQYATSALVVGLRQIPGYVLHQYDADVVAAMHACLSSLENLHQGTPQELQAWLSESLLRVQQAIGD